MMDDVIFVHQGYEDIQRLILSPVKHKWEEATVTLGSAYNPVGPLLDFLRKTVSSGVSRGAPPPGSGFRERKIELLDFVT